MRRWCSGNIQPFQGCASGSIPERRNKTQFLLLILLLIKYLFQICLFINDSKSSKLSILSRFNRLSFAILNAFANSASDICC
jgi:hypothetical protein